jgi:hypothetical protein
MQYMAEPVEIDLLIKGCLEDARKSGAPESRLKPGLFVDALEALVAEGWASASFDESRPESKLATMGGSGSR